MANVKFDKKGILEMIIECSNCETKVDAKLISEYIIPQKYGYSDPYKVCLLSCPSCKSAIVGVCEVQIGPDELGWSTQPERLWLDPVRFYFPAIPSLVSGGISFNSTYYILKSSKG